jgi:hypothetical protein
MVDGTYAHPDGTDASTLADWVAINEEAHAQIEFTIKDSGPLNTVADTISAKDAWNKLSERYAGKGTQRVGQLMSKVYNTKLNNTEPLENQIDDMLRHIHTINSLGHSFDDHLAAVSLINTLPATLSTLKTILFDSNTPVTTADIKQRILNDEQRRIGDSGTNATAFFARASKRPQHERGEKHNKHEKHDLHDLSKHCTHCDIDGHDITECRRLKRALDKAKSAISGPKDTKAKSKHKKASANIAITEEEDEESDTETNYSSTNTAIAMVSTLDHHTIGNQWILDSGTSQTMCSNCNWFFQFRPLLSPVNVILADDHTIQGIGLGRIAVQAKAGGKWHRTILQDILYVPKLRGNLLSVQQLVDRGVSVWFTKKGCQLLDPKGTTFCKTNKHGNLYPMPIRILTPESACVAMVQLDEFPAKGNLVPRMNMALIAQDNNNSKADAQTWHCCLGHLNDEAVQHMVRKGMVQGMEITGGGAPTAQCEPCIKGKQSRAEILKETKSRADTVLGRIFSDVCGKLPTCSIEGFEYFVTFIDDKSRKVLIQGLKKKSEVARHLKGFVMRAKADTGHRIQVLRSDGRGKYISEELIQWLDGKGIARELTMPDTPQHNGVAERMNRTLLDKV